MDSADLNVLRSVLDWRRAGERVLLYTVVQTWGSAPRPPGAMLALCGDGMPVGSRVPAEIALSLLAEIVALKSGMASTSQPASQVCGQPA